jgi:adenylate kinase
VTDLSQQLNKTGDPLTVQLMQEFFEKQDSIIIMRHQVDNEPGGYIQASPAVWFSQLTSSQYLNISDSRIQPITSTCNTNGSDSRV